jgi:antitoxin YefM
MGDADLQFVSDDTGQPVAVIVPIALWREIAAQQETVYLLKSETMRQRLAEARKHDPGISRESAAEKLRS